MWRGTRLEVIIVVILWNYMKSQEAIYHNLSRSSDCPFWFYFSPVGVRTGQLRQWNVQLKYAVTSWVINEVSRYFTSIFVQNRFIKMSLLKGKHVSTDICTNVVFNINFRGEKLMETPSFKYCALIIWLMSRWMLLYYCEFCEDINK